MRNSLILLVISVCLLSMGCSASEKSVYLTPVSAATLSAYKYKSGASVKNKLDAVIIARIHMQGWRIGSVGDPQVIYAEQIKPEEVYQKVGWRAADSLPKDTMVWLVIFEGEWQLIFPMPDEQGIVSTSEPPYHGCMFYLFAANGEGPSTGGDITCPPKVK